MLAYRELPLNTGRIQVGIRIALPEKMANLNISRKNETRCSVDYWSVSNSVKWNNQLLAKKPKVYYTGIHGNNMAKFIHYLILANTVISKLKWNQNVSVIFPIYILLMVMKSTIFV